MAIDTLLERWKKHRNSIFFGNDRRATITTNLIRSAGVTLIVLAVLAFVASAFVLWILVNPPFIMILIAAPFVIATARVLIPKLIDKSYELEKDYKNGKFENTVEVSHKPNAPNSSQDGNSEFVGIDLKTADQVANNGGNLSSPRFMPPPKGDSASKKSAVKENSTEIRNATDEGLETRGYFQAN